MVYNLSETIYIWNGKQSKMNKRREINLIKSTVYQYDDRYIRFFEYYQFENRFIIKMNQNKQQRKKKNQQVDIFSCTEQTIHLFDQFMSQEYAVNFNIKHLEDSLARFYNELIWAEKKNPVLVYQIFEMKALHQIIGKFINFSPVVLLRNSILLLGNCEPFGLVAEQLIQYQYPHFLLSNIFKSSLFDKNKEDIVEYMGNFFKCYHKLFKPEWLNKFIVEGDCFQLLELNLKYYNCLDLMARTNALNIVLDLLHYKEVRQFIQKNQTRKPFYVQKFSRMTKLFKNELVEFGLRISHISKEDAVDYIMAELEDKIALWVDFSNNFEGIQDILELPFLINVVLPLVISPIQFSQIPLFSFKFSIFVVRKLIPVMKNLKILEFYIRMIYAEDKVFYDPYSLRKSFLEPFNFNRLLQFEKIQIQDEQKQSINKIKSFYQSFFKSKDNHFILMKNALLTTLYKHGQACIELSKDLGLFYGGSLYFNICQNLLLQLKDIHQLSTIESILNTLILINNGKSLDTELQNIYIQGCKNLISKLRSGLNLSKDQSHVNNFNYLGQCIEYDIKLGNGIVLGNEKAIQRYENIFKIVFVWELKKQINDSQFYARVPDSPAEYLRYLFIKFMLLRKASMELIDAIHQDSLFQQYYQQFVVQCPYMAGDMYKSSQLLEEYLGCEIITQKLIQTGYFVKDSNFLVLARPIIDRVEIVASSKIKHAWVSEVNKKKKMKLSINEMDRMTNELIQKEVVELKYNESVLNYVNGKKNISIAKNIDFIRKCLQKFQNQLPSPSLI